MSASREVTFSVLCNDILSAQQRIFVVGDVPCLGAWLHTDAKEMKRSTDRGHVWKWTCTVTLPSVCEEVHYRYFIGVYLDPEQQTVTAEDNRVLTIDRWEIGRTPRLVKVDGESTVTDDVFGRLGEEREEAWETGEGWLVDGVSEIHIQVFSDAVQWLSKTDSSRPVLIRVDGSDVRCRPPRAVGADDSNDIDSPDVADSPYNSVLPTLVSDLTLPGVDTFEEQNLHGESITSDNFLMFRVRSVAPSHTLLLFTFSTPRRSDPDETRVLGYAHLLPVHFGSQATAAGYRSTLTIVCPNHRPIGHIKVNFALVHSLSNVEQPMACSFTRHWKARGTLDVGHRGAGNSYRKDRARAAAHRENTTRSFSEAAAHGAAFIEFDVHLSSDDVPIVYHDYSVCITLQRKKNGSSVENGETLSNHNESSALNGASPPLKRSRVGDVPGYELFKLPIRDLTLGQLQRLKTFHTSAHSSAAPDRVCYADCEDADQASDPFPTLARVLDEMADTLGFNIEVKYPLQEKTGEWECDKTAPPNLLVDRILETVYASEKQSRRIVFSSFDPLICEMLRLKQNRWPVMFLTQGKSHRYNPYYDDRTNCSNLAISFALTNQLLGVCFHAEELLEDTAPLKRCRELGLVSFIWGDDLLDKDNIEFFRRESVDAVIYDRITDVKNRAPNVFEMEKERKKLSNDFSLSHSRNGVQQAVSS